MSDTDRIRPVLVGALNGQLPLEGDVAWEALDHYDRLVARLEAAEAALAKARTFAEMVLECDSYGCENGPDKCLHSAASRQLDVLAAWEQSQEAYPHTSGVTIFAKFSALRARLEAAEAVARVAKSVYYGGRPGMLAAPLKAWERSQETGQP